MSNVDWDAIDAFVKAADKDDRIGEHDATVLNVSDGEWPSGDKFTELELRLDSTKNMAKIRVALGQPMSKDELAKVSADNMRGVALGQRLLGELHKYYGIDSPNAIKPQTRMRVKVVGQKSKKDGKEYPRVVAFKPAGEIGKTKDAVEADAPAF
jgi:hypothetical protein